MLRYLGKKGFRIATDCSVSRDRRENAAKRVDNVAAPLNLEACPVYVIRLLVCERTVQGDTKGEGYGK